MAAAAAAVQYRPVQYRPVQFWSTAELAEARAQPPNHTHLMLIENEVQRRQVRRRQVHTTEAQLCVDLSAEDLQRWKDFRGGTADGAVDEEMRVRRVSDFLFLVPTPGRVAMNWARKQPDAAVAPPDQPASLAQAGLDVSNAFPTGGEVTSAWNGLIQQEDWIGKIVETDIPAVNAIFPGFGDDFVLMGMQQRYAVTLVYIMDRICEILQSCNKPASIFRKPEYNLTLNTTWSQTSSSIFTELPNLLPLKAVFLQLIFPPGVDNTVIPRVSELVNVDRALTTLLILALQTPALFIFCPPIGTPRVFSADARIAHAGGRHPDDQFATVSAVKNPALYSFKRENGCLKLHNASRASIEVARKWTPRFSAADIISQDPLGQLLHIRPIEADPLPAEHASPWDALWRTLDFLTIIPTPGHLSREWAKQHTGVTVTLSASIESRGDIGNAFQSIMQSRQGQLLLEALNADPVLRAPGSTDVNPIPYLSMLHRMSIAMTYTLDQVCSLLGRQPNSNERLVTRYRISLRMLWWPSQGATQQLFIDMPKLIELTNTLVDLILLPGIPYLDLTRRKTEEFVQGVMPILLCMAASSPGLGLYCPMVGTERQANHKRHEYNLDKHSNTICAVTRPGVVSFTNGTMEEMYPPEVATGAPWVQARAIQAGIGDVVALQNAGLP